MDPRTSAVVTAVIFVLLLMSLLSGARIIAG